MKFLGEVTGGQATEAGRRLKALELKSATVAVRGTGAFPNASRPRVVWVGVGSDDSQKVTAMAEQILGSLKGIGEEDSRQFQPHLTLARVRSGVNKEPLEALIKSSMDRSFGQVTFSEFKLKSSVLTSKGPIYSDVGVYPLR